MLVVKLLGEFNVQLAGQPIDIPSRPAQTLLAYLVLHPHTACRREMLAGLIWPDANESNARSNLRHALWRIRKALGEQLGPEVFPSDDLTVAFSPPTDCWIDAHLVNGKTNTATALAVLKEAASAYQGELLPGFYDDWITLERERVQLAFEHKMDMLIARLVQSQSWTDTVEWAEHWIKFGTAPEPAFRTLMTAHAKLGLKAKVKEDYTRCIEALEREFGVEPSEETQALYQQLRSTRPLGTPALARPAPPHNLPTQATPLVGREAELAEITDRLVNDPGCRLLTLVGPGGVGKTRLALQVATQALDHFADGAFFVSFEPIATPAAMAAAILQKLSPVIHEQKDPHAQLLDYVRDKQLLLVLDNLEHLLEGAALIGEVLSTATDVKIIVTSRERLHLQWEWLYEVQGLDYPHDEAAIDIEHFSAVQLFLQTARRMRARFSLADEQPHVLRICQLVEGLPLGLELAASWIRVMACREIAQQIERNLDVLSDQLQDVPDRHRSARAVFEYSWSLLALEEQMVFMKLAVFPGGFRREAAEKVAGAPLSLLFTLVDKSLLRASAIGRYDMHSLLHQFVSEKLVQSGQESAIQLRLIHYYLDYARQHQHDYVTLEEERLNLIECIALARRNWLAQLVLDFAEVLGEMWSACGHWSDARKGYEWACDAARAHDDDKALAEYLCQWGDACIEQGDYDEAETLLEKSLDVAEKNADQRNAAYAQYDLAWVAIERSQISEAAQLLSASRAIFETLNEATGLAHTAYRQATVEYYYLHFDEAEQLAREALHLHESASNLRACLPPLRLLAAIAMHAHGDYAEAEQHGLRAIQLSKKTHDDAELAAALDSLAETHRRQGNLKTARQEAARSFDLFKILGARKLQAHLLLRLSLIDADLGALERALEEAQRSLQLCQDLQDPWGAVYIQDHLGEIYQRLGKTAQAHALWAEALSLATQLQHPLLSKLQTRAISNT
jgi:predicted ATPase/DNA-binding SARP family transcriptional activator